MTPKEPPNKSSEGRQSRSFLHLQRRKMTSLIPWPEASEVEKQKSREKAETGSADFFMFAGILSAALSQHHHLGFELAQLEFHHLY